MLLSKIRWKEINKAILATDLWLCFKQNGQISPISYGSTWSDTRESWKTNFHIKRNNTALCVPKKKSSQERMTSAVLKYALSINHNTYATPGLMVLAFHASGCYHWGRDSKSASDWVCTVHIKDWCWTDSHRQLGMTRGRDIIQNKYLPNTKMLCWSIILKAHAQVLCMFT